MLAKLATAAAVVMVFYCPQPADANARIRLSEPSRLETPPGDVVRLGAVRGRGVLMALSTQTEGRRTTLSFDIATTSRQPVEVSVPIYVAGDARVAGLVARIGDRELATHAMRATDATALFDAIKLRKDDPVLVERVASRASGDVLRVRAWPLTRGQVAHVELAIDAPPEGGWTIDASPAASVSETSSLIAVETPVAVPTFRIGCGWGTHVRGDLDKHIIRRYVRRQLPRINACYDRALLRDRTLTGRIELRFSIAPTGTTHDVSVDGELSDDALRTCIADELTRFEFPAVPDMGGTIRVNYPLALVPH